MIDSAPVTWLLEEARRRIEVLVPEEPLGASWPGKVPAVGDRRCHHGLRGRYQGARSLPLFVLGCTKTAAFAGSSARPTLFDYRPITAATARPANTSWRSTATAKFRIPASPDR